MNARLLRRPTLLLAAAALAAACGSADSLDREVAVGSDPAETTSTAPAATPNRFDPTTVTVGDRVAGLTITALTVSPPDAPVFHADVAFAGSVTLTGDVVAYDGDEMLGDEICLRNLADASGLPVLDRDGRTPWLCLTNRNEAAALYPAGTTTPDTIVVDEFTIHYAPSDVVNTARLTGVAQ